MTHMPSVPSQRDINQLKQDICDAVHQYLYPQTYGECMMTAHEIYNLMVLADNQQKRHDNATRITRQPVIHVSPSPDVPYAGNHQSSRRPQPVIDEGDYWTWDGVL